MSLCKLGMASRRAFHAAAPRAARILCLDNIDPVSGYSCGCGFVDKEQYLLPGDVLIILYVGAHVA